MLLYWNNSASPKDITLEWTFHSAFHNNQTSAVHATTMHLFCYCGTAVVFSGLKVSSVSEIRTSECYYLCSFFSAVWLEKGFSYVYFWSAATEEPGGLCGLCKSTQPSLQKICEERLRVHTYGCGWVRLFERCLKKCLKRYYVYIP